AALRWTRDPPLAVPLGQGVPFPYGDVVDAEVVKLNGEENIRQRQPHIVGELMNFSTGSTLEALTPQTVRFRFAVPDGGALAKISVMHIANRQFYRDVGWGGSHW